MSVATVGRVRAAGVDAISSARPGLLLGARVAHGEEGAHEAGEQRQKSEDLEEHERVEAGALGQPAQHQNGRVGDGETDDADASGFVAIGLRDRVGREEAEQTDAENPDEQLDAIAAQPLQQQHSQVCCRRARASSGRRPLRGFGGGELVAVVTQEQLLERRRAMVSPAR